MECCKGKRKFNGGDNQSTSRNFTTEVMPLAIAPPQSENEGGRDTGFISRKYARKSKSTSDMICPQRMGNLTDESMPAAYPSPSKRVSVEKSRVQNNAIEEWTWDSSQRLFYPARIGRNTLPVKDVNVPIENAGVKTDGFAEWVWDSRERMFYLTHNVSHAAPVKNVNSAIDVTNTSLSKKVPREEARLQTNDVVDCSRNPSELVFLPFRNDTRIVPAKNVNVATVDAFASNASSRKKIPRVDTKALRDKVWGLIKEAVVEEPRVETNAVEEPTRNLGMLIEVEEARDQTNGVEDPTRDSAMLVEVEEARVETNVVEEPTRNLGMLIEVEEARDQTNVVEEPTRDSGMLIEVEEARYETNVVEETTRDSGMLIEVEEASVVTNVVKEQTTDSGMRIEVEETKVGTKVIEEPTRDLGMEVEVEEVRVDTNVAEELTRDSGIGVEEEEVRVKTNVVVEPTSSLGIQVSIEEGTVETNVVEEPISDSGKEVEEEEVRVETNVVEESTRDLGIQVPIEEARVESNVIEEPTRDPCIHVEVEEARGETNVAEDSVRDSFDSSQTMDENHSQSCDRGLADLLNMYSDDASSEKVGSLFSSVSVEGYKVKRAAAPMLRSIFEKYGDIARDCTAMTVSGRSSFLEKICDIMQTLQESKFSEMSESDIKELKYIVKELGKDKLQVGWLLNRFEEILEAKNVMKDSSKLKEAKAAKLKSMQESEKAAQWYIFEIKERQRKIEEFDAKQLQCLSVIQELENKKLPEQENLKHSEAESKNIKARISSSKAKLQLFNNTSMIQDLV